MKSILKTAMAAMLAVTAMSGAAAAATKERAYDTFSHAGPAYGVGYLCVAGAAGGCGPTSVIEAMPFIPLVAGALDHIDMALENFAPTYGNLGIGVGVALVADNNGLPATNQFPLEEWVVTKVPAAPAPPAKLKLTKVISKRHPALSTSKKYWLVVVPAGLDTIVGWHIGNSGLNGVAVSTDGGASFTGFGTASMAYDVWIQTPPPN
ncbi:MAG TPA: hypothetical protein VG501_04155 [Rhizomicrobium sp.]|nr:hypothetical protein [Rhizomicrobium sp.]